MMLTDFGTCVTKQQCQQDTRDRLVGIKQDFPMAICAPERQNKSELDNKFDINKLREICLIYVRDSRNNILMTRSLRLVGWDRRDCVVNPFCINCMKCNHADLCFDAP
eukprot:930599_1